MTPVEPTPHPDVNRLLEDLLARQRGALGQDLLGVYLYGSAATAGFVPTISDVDLLAVTGSEVDDRLFAALQRLHSQLAADYPEWDDRVEVRYVPAQLLRTFRERPGVIGSISPGEPFNLRLAGRDWTMDWYAVRENGITLLGPPPATFIDPTSRDEFVESVREYALWPGWAERCKAGPGTQAYTILTMCRALYTCRHGEQVSKEAAAAWAARTLPDWALLVERALAWRRKSRTQGQGDGEKTAGSTQHFVEFAQGWIRANG